MFQFYLCMRISYREGCGFWPKILLIKSKFQLNWIYIICSLAVAHDDETLLDIPHTPPGGGVLSVWSLTHIMYYTSLVTSQIMRSWYFCQGCGHHVMYTPAHLLIIDFWLPRGNLSLMPYGLAIALCLSWPNCFGYSDVIFLEGNLLVIPR